MRCTLVSPVVMFCSAPAAASRVLELLSHLCSTPWYSLTTWGCHSHSDPRGAFTTSARADSSWLRRYGMQGGEGGREGGREGEGRSMEGGRKEKEEG